MRGKNVFEKKKRQEVHQICIPCENSRALMSSSLKCRIGYHLGIHDTNQL